MARLWNRPLPLKSRPIPYQIERYLLNHRDVRLVRFSDGWKLQGRTGAIHVARVPGSGRYSSRTVEICLGSLCTVHAYDERNRPDVVGLHPDIV
jgi:hypothetical protein